MPYYRLYFLGSASGGISEVREFEAEADEAAIAVSEQMMRPSAMELWSGERKVHRWESRGSGPPQEEPPAAG